jgi:uncharacterized protein with FMN-binding domain
MEGQEKKGNGVMIGTVAALIVAVAAYGFFKYTKKEDAQIANPIPVNPTTEVTTSYLYKDGNYSATGGYNSPGGAEEIVVNVTLKSDVITDVSVEPKATLPASLNWQTVVASNIKSIVVGKKLDEVVLNKVSGSSLTPKGWNDAIAKIKVSAKA